MGGGRFRDSIGASESAFLLMARRSRRAELRISRNPLAGCGRHRRLECSGWIRLRPRSLPSIERENLPWLRPGSSASAGSCTYVFSAGRADYEGTAANPEQHYILRTMYMSTRWYYRSRRQAWRSPFGGCWRRINPCLARLTGARGASRRCQALSRVIKRGHF